MSTELFVPSPQHWKPHAYQKRAIKFLLEHAAGALFLSPGLGKTSVTLAAFKMLKERGLAEKALLIAPLRVCHSVWPREIEKWTDFTGLRISILHGKKKDEALAADADIYIINPDGLPWLLNIEKTVGLSGRTKVNVDMKRWRSLGFDTLIVDELSKFKHTSTNRFKAIKQVLKTFGRRWGLTGSPAANGLEDLFGQCYVLDEGNALGRYITHFRMKYFTPSFDGFSWDLREGADEEIYARLKPLALRMGLEELDMPQLIENDIRVELPTKALEIYKHLENDLLTQIRDRIVVAANAAVASGKCRQVAGGAVYVDAAEDAAPLQKSKGAPFSTPSGREWMEVHEAKLDALEDLIDELQGQPLLVAYEFEHDLQRIRARLGKHVPFIGGGVSTKAATAIENDWNAGKIPVLLGHPKSLAHGLNLQAGGFNVCWFTPTWNFEEYEQFNMRIYRQGVKAKKVFVHHLVSAGTIDVDVLEALRSKRRGQEALFQALQRRARITKR